MHYNLTLLIFSFASALGLYIDPINGSCLIDTQHYSHYIEQFGTDLICFSLNPFSQTLIQVDVRHLKSISVQHQNESIFALNVKIGNSQSFDKAEASLINDLQIEDNKFSLYVTTQTFMWVYFSIKDGYQAYKYLLLQTVSVKMEIQNQRIPSQDSSFVFLVESLQNINLPYNRPDLNTETTYYLQKIPNIRSSSRMLTSIQTNNYWTTQQSLALPYIPYFSNCFGEGDRLYFAQLIQNPQDCSLIPINKIKPINEFMFGSEPYSDYCKIERQCIYDESPEVRSQFPYWQTLPEDTVLFSISQNKIPFKDYEVGMTFDDVDLVDCKINESKGTNTSSQFPLKVKLTLDYYQVTQQTKKMIACTVSYSLYTDSTNDFKYQLEIETRPLNHTNIMLAFGFQWYVYMIVFVLIGLISNIQNLILWVYHSCVSQLHKKQFRVRIYLRVIWQIAKGTSMGLLFFILLLFSVTMVMNGKIFDTYLYSSELPHNSPRVFWDSLNIQSIFDYSSSRAEQYRAGRMGISFLVVGSVIIFHTSSYFIGCEKKKKQYEDYWVMGRKLRPQQWNRGKFVFGTFFFIGIQFIFIYFAYSKMYSQNIWTFIVVMKIIQMVMEEITKSVFEDLLPCLPLKIITDITAYMNTLSANNFYDFLFSFLIDVAITMIQKAYISQLQNIIVQKIQMKIYQLQRFYANLINDTDEESKETSSEQLQQDQQNTFVLVNAITDEVKFFDHQETESHYDDSMITLNAAVIKKVEDSLREKLILYHKESNENNNNNILNIDENKRNEKKGDNDEEYSQSPSEKQRQKEEKSYIFQMLLDNIILLFTFFLQPFVVLVYWITYDESKILQNYGISSNVVVLYLLSAITIAAFTIINVILIFHLLQSYIEINFETPTAQLLNRFMNRSVFWKAHDEDINKQIGASLRGADHYCLSWQFFLLLTVYISSMILVMLGISILMNVQYNPLKDAVNFLIILFWYIFVKFLIWCIQSIGFKLNIDGWADKQNDFKRPNAIGIEEMKEDNLQKYQKNSSNESEQFTNQGLLINNSENQLFFGIEKVKNNRVTLKKIIPQTSQKVLSLFSLENENQKSQSILMNSIISEQNIKIKIDSICKKLQPKFDNQKFFIDYFRKNKNYLKQNLDKILPLVSEIPQINEYRMNTNQIQEIGGKKDNKSYDPSVLEVINRWKNRSSLQRQRRTQRGRQLQQNLVKCQFCFESWAIYHGFEGMCLKCSQIFAEKQKHQ